MTNRRIDANHTRQLNSPSERKQYTVGEHRRDAASDFHGSHARRPKSGESARRNANKKLTSSARHWRTGSVSRELRQYSLESRTPPPTTPLSRRIGLGGAWGRDGSQNQPLELTDSEIRRDYRGRSTPGSFEDINRKMSVGPRDVGQVVRRWGFKFAGDPERKHRHLP